MNYNQLYDKIEEFNESAKDVGKVVGIAALLASVTAIGSSVGKLISENSVKKIIKDDKNLKKLIETIEEDKKKLAIVNKKAAEKMDEYTELIKDYNELSVELGKPILKVDISTGEGESETKTSMVRDNSKYDPEKAMKYKHLKMKVAECRKELAELYRQTNNEYQKLDEDLDKIKNELRKYKHVNSSTYNEVEDRVKKCDKLIEDGTQKIRKNVFESVLDKDFIIDIITEAAADNDITDDEKEILLDMLK